ncbi:DUF4263 domain-containing protein [Streptosporangiaceae bacterium NEAU-GS5]|nr:DUF4263 domain-containing protein [Streptosporangiaceae bacterium NEAU-GS5]
MDQEEAERAFRVRIDLDVARPEIVFAETLEVKKGPQAWKAAKLLGFGDKQTGEIRKVKFAVEQYAAKRWAPGYQFDEKPERRWTCEGQEVDALRAFLNGNMPETGTYIRVDNESLPSAVLNAIREGDLSVSKVAGVLKMLVTSPDLLDELVDTEGAALLASLVETRRQRIALDKLRSVVEDSGSTEHDIQRVLDDNWWVFGGRFIRKEERRRLTVLDTIDIPLIRSDGALHIVELKRANIPKLLEKPRSHLIVSAAVHEATMQAVNYLRQLDHKRDSIWTDFVIDCSRATAVVVIGHPMFARDCDEKDISEALRTYNAALNRVEVITYKELIDGAERALMVGSANEHPQSSGFGDPQASEDTDPPIEVWESFPEEPPF